MGASPPSSRPASSALNFASVRHGGRPASLNGHESLPVEDHARRLAGVPATSEEGFIALPDLAGFFATESRPSHARAGLTSRVVPTPRLERRAYLERIGKTTPSARHAR